jgi:hypothetical protein
MKHAGADTLRELEPLLRRLRSIPKLVERKPGTFYLRSSAFLHFHEDPAGVFADIKLNGASFERVALRSEKDYASVFNRAAAAAERMSTQGRPNGAST